MTLNEICSIMCNNRRGINYLGRVTKNKRPIHPILDSVHNVTVKFEWADAFAGWTGEVMLEDFSWNKIVPAMDAVCKRYAPDTRAETMADKEHCPMMTYNQKTRTLTMYFTSNPDTAGRLLRYTMLDDITVNMYGDFERIDNLKDAYLVKVVTHKSTLNSGHPNHYKIHEGETRGDFLRRISDSIAEKGYSRMFTEVVYNSKGKPTLYFWVYKPAAATSNPKPIKLVPDDYIDTDMAARRAEVTQLLLSSKLRGFDTVTKMTNFLYDAAKIILQPNGEIGDVSDGYHTFNELYHHRAILFATLCNLMPSRAWKSKHHGDPNFPMYDGMFICGISTPDGQATYHYDIDPYWDMFRVPEIEKAPRFDGHTPAMAIERIKSLAAGSRSAFCTIQYRNKFTDECDAFLLDDWKKHAADFDLHTEFFIDGCDMFDGKSYIIGFRFPGATRGHVKLDADTGRVTEVTFYETAYSKTGIACYKTGISSLVLRWEGGMMTQLLNWCKRRQFGGEVVEDDGVPAILE